MKTIVMAANAEADQPWVADAAAELSKETGARVAVVSVDELETEKLSVRPRKELLARAEEAARTAVDRLRSAGVEATEEVRSGRALDEILAFADEQEADLVVVGTSVRGPVATRLLGTVPLALVQRSPRPVLVVTGPRSPTA